MGRLDGATPGDDANGVVHLTFEEDTIVKAPFAGWEFPDEEEKEQ